MSYFGTDGIRGKFGELPITPDFILKLGYVTGQVLIENNENAARRPSVVIGKDTRLSGYVIEGALQAGFNAAGVDVHMLGPLPTPAIAHLTRSFNADAGVVISASHNPYYDNGIKLFSGSGKKLTDNMQNAINDKLKAIMSIGTSDDSSNNDLIMPILDPSKLGKNNRINDAKGRYIEFCKGSFPYQYDLSHLTVVLDCANGAGYSVAPRVMRELGANVIAINNTPDGLNINADCGSTHPEGLQQAVIKHEADVGIALDGDGDRIVMVDEAGKLVDGDGILYVLATQGQTKAKGVVGTLMSGQLIGPNTLEEILCSGTIEAISVTDDGKPLNAGRRTAKIPGRLRKFVIGRDGGCCAEGCTSRYRLQVHHRVHWSDGGETDADNLVTLCWFHHHVVIHQRGFTIAPESPPHRLRFKAPQPQGP